MLLGLAGCDGRCGGSSVGTESPPPAPETVAAEEVAPEVAPPMKEVHVTLADVEDIPYGELRIVEAPKYEVRKLGKPTVLMEGKHLRLPDTPWPLAPDRGFVLVQDGPDYESNVLEARLLDLRTGEVVASLRKVYRSIYAELGVALGQAEVDGTLHEVLVHASDGQIVPLWPVEQAESRFVVINAGTGDAWVFKVQPRKEDAEEDPYPPYRYAYWGDLRKRPPEPKEAFAHEIEQDSRPPGGWLGPTWSDPAKAPLFLEVDSDNDECAKVELRPDGYKCVPFGTWAMAAGWLGTVEENRPLVMSNAERGEAQVLDLGKRCVIEEVTLDPPRAILECQEPNDRFLWSPQEVVRLRPMRFGVRSWSRSRRVMSVTHYLEPEGVERISQTWLDVAGLRVVDSPRMSNVSSMFEDGWLILREGALFTQVYVANPTLDDVHRVPIDTRDCVYRDSMAGKGAWFISTCAGDDESVKSMALVDVESREVRPIPILNQAWLMTSQRILIGSHHSRGVRILRWDVE